MYKEGEPSIAKYMPCFPLENNSIFIIVMALFPVVVFVARGGLIAPYVPSVGSVNGRA